MRIEGRERLRAKLKAIPQAAKDEIHRALLISAEEMTAVAKAFVPKRTGALSRSIGFTFGPFQAANANVRGVSGGGALEDKDLSVTIHAGDATAFYAAFVEFGTKPHEAGGKYKGAMNPGATAQPYFFPAYRLTKKRMKGRISRATTKAARKVARG